MIGAFVTFRGNTPAEDSSDSVESPNKAVRCCAFCGARRERMRRARSGAEAFLPAQIGERSRESTRGRGAKLGIRLWIMLRDQIDYPEFRRRAQLCEHRRISPRKPKTRN